MEQIYPRKEMEKELWMKMQLVNVRLRHVMEIMAEQEGLSFFSFVILAHIRFAKSITMGELTRKLAGNQGNISTLCKKLEEGGWLEKKRLPQDERVVQISLTPAGTEKIQKMEEKMHQILIPIIESTDLETMEILIKGLDSAMKTLDELIPLYTNTKQI